MGTGGGILVNLLSKALNAVLRLFGRKLPPEDELSAVGPE